MNLNGKTLLKRIIRIALIAVVVVLGGAHEGGSNENVTAIHLAAQFENPIAEFRMKPNIFVVPANTGLSEMKGEIALETQGQGFSEALVTVWDVPQAVCSKGQDVSNSYRDLRVRYPGSRVVGSYIIKMPEGISRDTLSVHSTFAEPLLVHGCLMLVLDGAVLQTGGPFRVTSDITATIVQLSKVDTIEPIRLDDEFCFDREGGCQLHTVNINPNSSFQRVALIKNDGFLINMHGSISDSAFGKKGARSDVPWIIENRYYVVPACGLAEGISGPSDFRFKIPANARLLKSSRMQGLGQTSLEQTINEKFRRLPVVTGDCIIHLVWADAETPIGGIDAESQIILVQERAQ